MGGEVRYRYTTNDGRYALVRDATKPRGNNWLFVPVGCISYPSIRYYAEFYPNGRYP